MHAVATMFNVCVVVVNHGHQSAYLFGDSSHQRIYLYQKIEATHYDALLPDKSCDICSEVEDDEANGERHCASPPPPLLYINAWADGVVTPVLTNSTDDADADSKQVQLMNLGLPVISSSELAAVPSFDGAALSSFSAVAYPDAATRAAQRHQVTTGLPHAACSQAPPYTTIQIMRAQQPTRRPTLPHIQNTTSPS